MQQTAAIIAGLTFVLAVASVTLNHLRLRRRIALETTRAAAVVEPAPWEREGGRDLTAPPPEAVAHQLTTETPPTASGPAGENSPHEASRPPESISLVDRAPEPLRLPPGAVMRRPDRAAAAPALLRRDLTRALDAIPKLPPGTHAVLKHVDQPGPAARTLSAVVATEPFVLALLLRGANAVIGDGHEPVETGEDAMHCLGVVTTRSLVLRQRVAIALRDGVGRDVLADPGRARAAQQLWSHAMAVAAAAEHLAVRAGGTDPAQAATIGLLHDVGKLAMLRVGGAAVAAVADATRDGAARSTLARERHALGGDHAAVGAYLAARWELPSDVTEGIRRHHLATDRAVLSLKAPLRRAVLVVHVANQLVKYVHAYAGGVEIDPVPAGLLAELGLPAAVERVMDEPLRKVIGRALDVAAATAPVAAPRPLARAG